MGEIRGPSLGSEVYSRPGLHKGGLLKGAVAARDQHFFFLVDKTLVTAKQLLLK